MQLHYGIIHRRLEHMGLFNHAQKTRNQLSTNSSSKYIEIAQLPSPWILFLRGLKILNAWLGFKE